MEEPKNLIYAQSGGATAVINVTARALILEAQKHPEKIGKIYVANGGITGVLQEKIFDVTGASEEDVNSIANEPGAFFGTCRYKLTDPSENDFQYRRLFDVFKAHNIGYFFYNGGNDSQDTTNRIAQWCAEHGHNVQCLGIPKTVDNDLVHTDSCPGFGSVAKYIAVSTAEVNADLLSICGSSTKVFIMETMGRDAGWITASAGLIKRQEEDAPHILLLPEIPLKRKDFLARVKHCVENIGCCVIVASEGLRDENNEYLAASSVVIDSFGHQQLGGVAPILAGIVKQELGYKYHWAVPDYMQRAAKHLVSAMDYEQAQAVGKAAVTFALQGKNAVMSCIERISDSPYKWKVGYVPLNKVANAVKAMPRSFISDDGYSLTDEARAYYMPLIEGEVYPSYDRGLLKKASLQKKEIPSKLVKFKI